MFLFFYIFFFFPCFLMLTHRGRSTLLQSVSTIYKLLTCLLTYLLFCFFNFLSSYKGAMHVSLNGCENIFCICEQKLADPRFVRSIRTWTCARRHHSVNSGYKMFAQSLYPYRNTPFTRSSKHRTIIEQTTSKCIRNTRARRVL